MIDAGTWSLYAAGALALLIAPGPDFLYVMTRGVGQGRKAGVLSAIGISLGLLAHTLLAALGLTALLATSATAFEIAKVIGAAYLIYLGIKALRSHNLLIRPDVVQQPKSDTAIIRQGALTNLLNPKAVLTFLAFIPQFIDPARASGPQIVVLGVTIAVLGVSWFSLVGFFAGSIGQWLSRSRFSSLMRWLTGGIFIGLGLRLAFAERR